MLKSFTRGARVVGGSIASALISKLPHSTKFFIISKTVDVAKAFANETPGWGSSECPCEVCASERNNPSANIRQTLERISAASAIEQFDEHWPDLNRKSGVAGFVCMLNQCVTDAVILGISDNHEDLDEHGIPKLSIFGFKRADKTPVILAFNPALLTDLAFTGQALANADSDTQPEQRGWIANMVEDINLAMARREYVRDGLVPKGYSRSAFAADNSGPKDTWAFGEDAPRSRNKMS